VRHFDPRYNTSSGKRGYEPYTKSENITPVAKMGERERDNSAGLKFRFGENRAKKIDHDLPPQ
jgi:hypothetical protein